MLKYRVGEKRIANNGQSMTIIAYRGNKDVDIEFEDGTIVINKSYYAFYKGSILNPNYRINKKSKAKNGENITIISYKSNKKIDVQFNDGTIVKNTSYKKFINNEINKPNYNKNIGKTIINENGHKLSIIAYKNHKDIDVLDSNTSDILNMTYLNFRTLNRTKKIENDYKQRMGEKKIANNGQEMIIIGYKGCREVTVQFEDGTVVNDKTYKNFQKGDIKNPNYHKNKRLGKINKSTKGQQMEIIEYRTNKDIDIRFEDGTIVRNKRYFEFMNGSVKNPNFKIV